jgi:hypothetical protein
MVNTLTDFDFSDMFEHIKENDIDSFLNNDCPTGLNLSKCTVDLKKLEICFSIKSFETEILL